MSKGKLIVLEGLDGSMSCGRAAEMRKKYAFLKGDEMV